MIATRLILSDYIAAAMREAIIERLEDGTYIGRIEGCPGLLSFGATAAEATDDLRVNLEDWILVGLKLGDKLPVIEGIDLNEEPRLEPVDSL